MPGRLAVVVGIDSYINLDGMDLSCCVRDAEEIGGVLSEPEYGFTVSLHTDGMATRYNIRAALASALDEAPDFFIFYFAGHGTVTPLGSFLVTHDGRPHEEGISLGELSSILERIAERTRHSFMILDCCHSGGVSIGGSIRELGVRDIEHGVQTKSESRSLLAACRPEQGAEEDPQLGHGVFTHALLQGLCGNAVDKTGTITVGTLSEYIASELEQQAAEQITVSKGDQAGRVVLATGFPPASRNEIPQQARRRLIEEGRQYLNDYISQLSSRLEDWTSHGHRAASQALAPTLRWFENQRQNHGELRSNPEFSSLYGAVLNRVKALAEIDIGTVLAEGTVTCSVGAGGFGTVWKIAPFDESGKSLAYKLYHPAQYSVEEKRKLFTRGYRAMLQLDHPRIVKVHRSTECPLGFFMDYIEGPNLRSLPNIFDDPRDLIRFLILTGETIAHAHSRNVIHRDIKPENILATYNEDDLTWLPYLTDFDLAWFSQATQVTKEGWANLSYAAPEQLGSPRSNAARQPAVDIYAFGQLAYFAVTGSDPSPLRQVDNTKLLREKLTQWSIGSTAQQFLQWYETSTQMESQQRYPDFRTGLDELLRIELDLRDLGTSLSDEQVMREIAFGLSGFSATFRNENTELAFPSTAGRTSISLKTIRRTNSSPNSPLEVEARMTLDRIAVDGTDNNERARAIINNRIDEVLRGEKARRRPGSHGTFETYITVHEVTCDRTGVDRARKIFSRAIETIER